MATDTARVHLELASGRNEITAPFHQTAQRRRQQLELDAASVDAPVDPAAATQIVFDMAPAQFDAAPNVAAKRPGTARPPWIAFIAALVAVGLAVWWVMSQRMPDIDPRAVIARNLSDAETAMADGRYSDPPERSAFHYYSTVLALDPSNVDAIAGIDSIADRHLSKARWLLEDRKIAEAGVALEKARRVRPEHEGLATLDAQWRSELRKLLTASTVVATPVPAPIAKPSVAKPQDPVVRPSSVAASRAKAPTTGAAPKIANPPPRQVARSAPDVKNESVASMPVTDLSGVTAALAAIRPSPKLDAVVAPPAPEPQASTASPPNTTAATVPAPVATSVEPKLIKMVQPEYPQEAMMRGLEGWVEVSLQVSPSGDVVAPRVEESSRGRMFNRAALNAVQQWKYEPRSDGTTSERVHVRLKFTQSN